MLLIFCVQTRTGKISTAEKSTLRKMSPTNVMGDNKYMKLLHK